MNTFIFFALFFLFGLFALTAVTSAFRRVHKRELKKQLKLVETHFFYRKLHLYFFPHHEFEGLFFASLAAQSYARFCYAALIGILLVAEGLSWASFLMGTLILLPVSYFFGEFLPKLIGSRYPEKTLKTFGWIASIFITLSFPFIYFFLKLWQKLTHSVYFESPVDGGKISQKEILDILDVADSKVKLDTQEKKILESVITFRDRVAREVMIPRMDTFALPASLSIKDAAYRIQEEGYSRTPVYKDNIDEVMGVLMWKDLLTKYREAVSKSKMEILDLPIETLIKPIIYTPETKKISLLLQEFRKKQMHLAIVVDEYGCTEGIVTIEDILEEIVGEIEDEYDEQLELFKVDPQGGWIVDARMTIHDIEDHLHISIPQEGDYDTLAGYIFHQTGAIPPPGFKIEHDLFTIDVVTSSERNIGRVKIVKR